MTMDRRQIRRAFGQAVESYDRVAVLQQRIGENLLQRLDLLKINPKRVLDLGCGTGVCLRALEKRYPGAQVLGLDFALAMAQWAGTRTWRRRRPVVAADAEYLPFQDNTIDLVISNLMLQWCDTTRVCYEISRVLAPHGVCLLTTFATDTLKELRAAWQIADPGQTHVSDFIDMHDLGDILLQSGMLLPVVDADRYTLTYAELGGLFADLKGLGAVNAAKERRRGLSGKQRHQTLLQAYQEYRDSDGRLPATFEVVFGHAWATEISQNPASVQVSVPEY